MLHIFHTLIDLPLIFMMSHSEIPSSTVSHLSTLVDVKTSLDTAIEKYQALNPDDETVGFLQVVLKFLPTNGQHHLIEDVVGCQNDETIRQLANSLDRGFLLPMLSQGGKTPVITPSPYYARMNLTLGDVNREDNMISMVFGLHEAFGLSHFILEAMSIPTRYYLKTVARFSSCLKYLLSRDNIVSISSKNIHFGVPNPDFLAVHAAIRNI